MHLSRTDRAILCGVTVAGIGVIATAALADELGIRKKREEENEIVRLLTTGIELPSMPRSKEDFIHMWASGYETFKKPLSVFFEVTGQVLVAPIAMVAFDAVYEKINAKRVGDANNTWSGAA